MTDEETSTPEAEAPVEEAPSEEKAGDETPAEKQSPKREAELATANLEKSLVEARRLIDTLSQLKSEMQLGGRSEAGTAGKSKEELDEEINQKEAEKLVAGTGLNPFL